MAFARVFPANIVVLASLIHVVGSTTLIMTSVKAVPMLTGGASTAGTAAGTAVAEVAGAAETVSTVIQAAGTACTGFTAAGTAALLQNLGSLSVAGSSLVLALGAIVVGAQADSVAVSWDCWKPILHETSLAPSRGRLLLDILNDPAIVDAQVGSRSVFVRNRWNESWRIDPFVLPWGQVAAHASQLVSTPFNHSTGSSDTIGKTCAT
eukprot:TRINITY_DN6387_c0_g1_i1.p1 TRINITY_DN6387_c0_g1~~TRINITY_DN6387_c0_g1_i1.p1  ORF type:complete len:242 (+),score=20.83 TRINITY_DN6387_c0_g1_i1:103-726(+)